MNPQRILRIVVLFLASALLRQASAQMPLREPTPNDRLISPEVSADHRVTFRIYAPKASEVSVSGDWIAQGRGTGGNPNETFTDGQGGTGNLSSIPLNTHTFGIGTAVGSTAAPVGFAHSRSDAWEFMDLDCYPEKYAGYAIRVGLNFMIYAMTH